MTASPTCNLSGSETLCSPTTQSLGQLTLLLKECMLHELSIGLD